MFRLISILFIFKLFSIEALASEKYCLKEETSKPIVINKFGESYQNKDDKRAFLNGLNKISQSFLDSKYESQTLSNIRSKHEHVK